MCPSCLNSNNQIKFRLLGWVDYTQPSLPSSPETTAHSLLNGHSTAVCHLIHLKPQPYPKQVTALSRHLYPCTDGGACSSWGECLGVMTLDFFRGQPAARMIVLMDSFLLDPSQLSRRREVRVSGDPVYVFMLIITNLVLGKGTIGCCICSGKVLSKPGLRGIFIFQKRLNSCLKGLKGGNICHIVIFCRLQLKSISNHSSF